MCISCFTLDSRNIPHFLIFVLCMNSAPAAISLHVEKDDFCVGSHFPHAGKSCEGPTTVSDHRSYSFEFIFFLLSLIAILITRIRINTGFMIFVDLYSKKTKKLIRLWKPLNTQWLQASSLYITTSTINLTVIMLFIIIIK